MWKPGCMLPGDHSKINWTGFSYECQAVQGKDIHPIHQRRNVYMADSTDGSPRLHRSSWTEEIRKLGTISLKGLGILLQEPFRGRKEALDEFINSIRSQIPSKRDLDWIDEHAAAFRVDVINLVHSKQTLSITFRSRVMSAHHPLIINVYLEHDQTIRPGSMLVVSKLQ
jgi:hypothetical protein